MNKIKKTIILIILLLSPILLTACLWTFALGGMYLFTPTPSQPKVKTGEFPFEVVYKLNGETCIIRDVYVCTYDGVGFNEGDGKYRKWKGYVKGTGESDLFITEDSNRQIFCFVGSAEFYMDDEKYPEKRPLTPRLYDIKKNHDTYSLTPYEIAEVYNIEILSWNFSDPIKNSFQ